MEVDTANAPEASDDSSSGPEEITNKDAKEEFVTTFKAEIASQRSLKEKAKKLKIQVELRNIEQKKIKEEKREAGDDSSLQTVKNEMDDAASSPEVVEIISEKPEESVESKKNKKRKNRKKRQNLGNNNGISDSSTVNSQAEIVKNEMDDAASSPEVVEIISEKPEESVESKKNKKLKNRKKRQNLGNNNGISDSSAVNSQADTKSDSTVKSKPEKLSCKARKKARVRQNIDRRQRRGFIRACLGKAHQFKGIKNKSDENSDAYKRDNRRFKSYNAKSKNSRNNVAPVVVTNHSTEKTHGEKRKFEATKNDTPKIKSMKTVTHNTEQAVKVKTEPTIKVKTEPTVKIKTEPNVKVKIEAAD